MVGLGWALVLSIPRLLRLAATGDLAEPPPPHFFCRSDALEFMSLCSVVCGWFELWLVPTTMLLFTGCVVVLSDEQLASVS